MQPYVIKQGDYLANLAYRFGFDADTVWNDPSNAQLRALRPNPNILFPSDVLYIPDQAKTKPKMFALTQGSTNSFTSTPPMVDATLRFLDPACASQACAVQELPQLTELQTDADGKLSLSLPVSLGIVTVVFTQSGAIYVCRIGHMDPIDTLSGAFLRLQNLGYIDTDTPYSPDLDFLRAALRRFKADQPGAAVPPSDPAPSAPEPSASDDDDSPSSSSPSSGPIDDAGLSDDGVIDSATAQLLMTAHGS